MTTNSSPVIAKVCKHAIQTMHRFDKTKDLLCAKITNIHEDGTRSNSFIGLENYKQPIWIVKSDHRKFKQHKDYIEERYVKEFKVPRCQLGYFISKVLYGRPDRDYSLREAANSPYVFGLDQTPAVHLKNLYFERYPEYQETEAYSMAAYDVETDMFQPHNPVMMASVTFKERAFFAAVRSWYPDKDDETILRNLKNAEDLHLGDRLKQRNCTVEYLLVDTPGEVVKACIDKMHEWQPDWVTAWNAAYDMRKNEEALVAGGYDLADVYSDPRVPKAFRSYKLDYGRTHKRKENGDKTPLEDQERFPTIRCPATFQFADAMSFYAIKRVPAEGKLESYSLQNTAIRHGLKGKLYTTEGSKHVEGSEQWHKTMQKEYPYIYSMYNIDDNFAIEEINETTSDFALSLPMLLKYSEYFNYVSQPKLISDTLSFIARKNGYVWGSTPSNRDTSFSDLLPELKDWIALVDTEKNASVGRALFDGLDDVISNGRAEVADIDVEGAYPHAGLTENTSNKTTMAEVYEIQWADATKFREIAVNYASSPQANALELGQALFNFPKVANLQAVFEKKLKELGMEKELEELKKKQAEMNKQKEAA